MPTTAAPPSRNPRPVAPRPTGAGRFTDVWNGRHAALPALHDARTVLVRRGGTASALPGRARVGVLGAVGVLAAR